MNKFIGLFVLVLGFTATQVGAEALNYNIINLSETATRTVDRDEMTVVLSVAEEGRNPAELANAATLKANQVIRLANQNKQLTVMQSSRKSTRIEKKTFGDVWQEKIAITITGKDFAAINQIIAQVNNIARIDNVYFAVSRETREKLENELTVEALKRVGSRATLIGRTLGLSDYRLVNMNIGSNNAYNRVRYNMPVMKSASAPSATSAIEDYVPETASGEETLSLSVNAQVQLYQKSK